MSVWHPSYLLLLLRYLRANWSSLLTDLRSGFSLSEPRLHIRADRTRATQLESLRPDDTGRIWPKLRLISCWGDAQAAASLDDVRAAFPAARIQPKGLIATEALITLTLGELNPLAIRSHFFEFVDDQGDVRPSWDLEHGRVYTLIVTTGGGLYRYKVHDRVEVTSFYRQVPSLRFLGKEDSISDFRGEKLTEAFVASVLESIFRRYGISPQFAMLALDESGDTPGYTLYLQCDDEIPANLEEDLESALGSNPNYALCTRLGQLRRIRVTPIKQDAYEVYANRLTELGMRLGDIKPSPLSRLTDWTKYFAGVAAA